MCTSFLPTLFLWVPLSCTHTLADPMGTTQRCVRRKPYKGSRTRASPPSSATLSRARTHPGTAGAGCELVFHLSRGLDQRRAPVIQQL